MVDEHIHLGREVFCICCGGSGGVLGIQSGAYGI